MEPGNTTKAETKGLTPARRGFLASVGKVLAWGAIASLALNALGGVLTDRFFWSQYLFWMPTLVVCAGAGVLLAAAYALAAIARRRTGVWIRFAGLVVLAGTLVHTFTMEWSGGGAQPLPPREQRLRLVFWNFSLSGEPGWESPAIDLDPDIVVVRAGTCTKPEGVVRRMGEGASFCWEEGFMVTSKMPIKAYGSGPLNVEQGLGLDPRAKDFVRKGRDPGRGMWLLLDAKSRLGRDVVVWLVDIPSDLSLWRGTAMREAEAALKAGPLRRYVADELGRWVEAPEFRLAKDVFATPDLIVGDFNTPRGAHSLQTISMGYASAYDEAGVGYAATFPRAWPLWQLDHAFIRPTLRACDHQVIDTGSGTHRMMVFDVEVSGAR